MAKTATRSESISLSKSHSSEQPKVVPLQPNVAIGSIAQPMVAALGRIDDEGRAFILASGSSDVEIEARSIVALNRQMVGRSVLVVFEKGDPMLPIITGLIQSLVSSDQVIAETDGKRLVLSAENEVTLKCGDAKITLTKQGKVLIQGTYILSRSTGANKIKGAVIDIN